MKITRWTAQLDPKKDIIVKLFHAEGLDGSEVTVEPGKKMANLRTNMREIIQVINGELIFNLSGNQFVLRSGDKLEMASNTSYSYSNLKNESCLFLTAQLI
jgi:quercetin dioxygenase-like cupin family protein